MRTKMRAIEFRGKTKIIAGDDYNHGKKDGEWVYGYYFDDLGLARIRQFEYDRADYIDYEVDPNTIGQYTGKTDKNGKKIYEGDIIEYYVELLVVKYGEHDVIEQSNERGNHFRNVKKFGWFGERVKGMPSSGIDLYTLSFGEVVGNIYDNKF